MNCMIRKEKFAVAHLPKTYISSYFVNNTFLREELFCLTLKSADSQGKFIRITKQKIYLPHFPHLEKLPSKMVVILHTLFLDSSRRIYRKELMEICFVLFFISFIYLFIFKDVMYSLTLLSESGALVACMK